MKLLTGVLLRFVLYLRTSGDVVCLIDPTLPDIFYPFGADLGDSIAPVSDDGYTGQIPIGIGFPFFSSTRRSLYVNTNGAVSFEGGVSSFTPSPFPLALAYSMVAVYWCDVDTSANNGRIYYRETTESGLLTRASSDVQSAFSSQGFHSFQASWVFIATWHNVTYYGGNKSTPVQTFQLILVTDRLNSFALFNYGKLVWTTGTSGGGSSATGLGGTAAQVGFNAGDAVKYYAVPLSRTPDIVNIWTLSNVGRTGRWGFRIDEATIAAADINGCQSSPCNNGGSCTDAVNSYTCRCLPGYTGPSCETNINECLSSPCRNGGSCTDAVNSYTCRCVPGYSGTNCETNTDECASDSCLNGGTCLDHVNGYTCQCGVLYTGVHCETATACLIANGQQRKSCGKFSQTEQECIDNGCCWDGSHAEKICFKKLIKKCSIAEAVRTQCPGLLATEGECTANGCCWDNQFKLGSARCYLPGYE